MEDCIGCTIRVEFNAAFIHVITRVLSVLSFFLLLMGSILQTNRFHSAPAHFPRSTFQM